MNEPRFNEEDLGSLPLVSHPEEAGSLRLDSAIEVTHVDMETDTINQYQEAVNQYQNILTQAIAYPIDSFTAYFLHDAYDRMVQALGNGVAEGQIAIGYEQPLSETFQQVLTAQDTMVNRIEHRGGANLSYDAYQRKFKVKLDKAHVFRLGQKRQQALAILANIASWAEPDELSMVNYWQCVNQAEYKVTSGQIPVDSFNIVYDCQYPHDSLNTTPKENLGKRGFKSFQENTNQSSGHQLKVFPNPLSDATTIRFTLEASKTTTLKLVNGQGKSVRTLIGSEQLQKGKHTVTMQAEELPAGVYFIELTHSGKNSKSRRIVVQ